MDLVVSRRRFIVASIGTVAGIGMAGAGPRTSAEDLPDSELRLVAAPKQVTLPGMEAPSSVWTYGPGVEPVVLRVPRGEPFRVTFENELPEHSSVHWHGIRGPNAMDGVPYVTQPPVNRGQRFVYEFTPPDTGTFFFHPHCNTVEQLGRGLAGVIVVEGDTDHAFDADLVLVCKDWIVQDDGTLGPFLTSQGAARGGTLGNITTVNGITDPVLEVPPNADIRLRFLNLDSSRIIDLAVEGAEAWGIATDGNALDPFLLDEWRTGPAMRLDIALRTPAMPGAEVALMNNRSARPIRLARLRTSGPAVERKPFVPPRLKGPHLPEPDLEGATVLPFIFSTGSAKSVPPDLVLPNGEVMRYADLLCLSPKTFWAINRQTWPEHGHEALPPPIATLERGRTYVFELQNTSKIIHPIHLHGHSFKVLDSSEMAFPVHWADTTLIHPRERRRVAFVADNPGDWMFHCHIIEHQETGMMAIVRVA